MKYIKHILVVLLLVSFASGQEVSTPDSSYTNITPDELNERLIQGDQFLLVNTHIPYEGELEGTDSFIPYNEVEAHFTTPVFPKDEYTEIVVYCMSGRMSEIAAETLVELGYRNVKNLSGGMLAWQRSGFELVDNRETE